MIQQKNLPTMSPLTSETNIKTERALTQEQIAQYHEDGFVIVPNFFEPEEIKPLMKACTADPDVADSQTVMDYGKNRTTKVSVWSELGDSYLGVLPRMARIVDAVEILFGEKCYHWHSKLVLKQPNEGYIPWHQEYGTWYEDGCLFPHLISCGIALQKTNRENGCLKVVKKSHLLGRIDNVIIGGTTGGDPTRVKLIVDKLEVVYCEMEPGDAIFLHSNTLHGSETNRSQSNRSMLYTTHNALSNQPDIHEGQEHHRYRPLIKMPDSTIKDGNYTSIFDTQKFLSKETKDDPGSGLMVRFDRIMRKASEDE